MTYEEAYARVKRVRDSRKWMSNKAIASLMMLAQEETEKRFEAAMDELHIYRVSEAVERDGLLDRAMSEPYDPQIITDPSEAEQEGK